MSADSKILTGEASGAARFVLFEYLFLIAVCAANLFISCLHIQSPGLAPDETYFCNVALGCPFPELFAFRKIELFGHVIPIMSQGHIGLSKSLLYAPLFALVPPSAMSIRLPSIIIGLVTVVLTYLLTRRMFGVAVAVVATILFASDPNTIASFRMDHGPSTIATLCRVAFMYFAVKCMQGPCFYSLFFVGLFAGFGLWDKLEFAWFIIAFLAALLFDRREPIFNALKTVLKTGIRGSLLESKENAMRWLVFTLGFACGGLPLWVHNFPVPNTLLLVFWRRTTFFPIPFSQKLNVLLGTLDGSGFYELTNGKPPFWPPYTSWAGELLARTPALEKSLASVTPSPHTFFPFLCFFGFLILAYLLYKPSDRLFENRCVRFVLVMLVVLFVEILLTRQSYGPHHFFNLYPFLQILIAYAFMRVWLIAEEQKQTLKRDLISLCLVAGVVSNYIAVFRYAEEYRQFGGRGIWSDASYQLADYMNAHKNYYYAFFDYGIMHQLVPLTKGQFHGREYTLELVGKDVDQKTDETLNQLLRRKNVLFVVHTPETTQLNQPMKHLKMYLEKNQLQIREVGRFLQKDGLPTILLLKPEPKIPAGAAKREIVSQ